MNIEGLSLLRIVPEQEEAYEEEGPVVPIDDPPEEDEGDAGEGQSEDEGDAGEEQSEDEGDAGEEQSEDEGDDGWDGRGEFGSGEALKKRRAWRKFETKKDKLLDTLGDLDKPRWLNKGRGIPEASTSDLFVTMGVLLGGEKEPEVHIVRAWPLRSKEIPADIENCIWAGMALVGARCKPALIVDEVSKLKVSFPGLKHGMVVVSNRLGEGLSPGEEVPVKVEGNVSGNHICVRIKDGERKGSITWRWDPPVSGCGDPGECKCDLYIIA